MSSNVGLSTPRGSGTSGYVQRNLSHFKPRDSGYGAPYPPPSSSNSESSFKQRKPDRQILEHDRKRAIEVKILEERDRLEEENEKIDEEGASEGESKRVKLSDDEIEERLDFLRTHLTRELEDELAGKQSDGVSRRDTKDKWRPRGDGTNPKGRKQFKAYQVHELAEAKIEESERLRKALGIRDEEGEVNKNEPRDGGRRYADSKR